MNEFIFAKDATIGLDIYSLIILLLPLFVILFMNRDDIIRAFGGRS